MNNCCKNTLEKMIQLKRSGWECAICGKEVKNGS